MDIKEQQKRSEKLINLIKELSVSQDVFAQKRKYNDFYMRLKNIYHSDASDKFRHLYNDIFSVIAEIDSGESTSVDILGENIRLLYEYCLTRNDPEVKESIIKLYDHISLDIARIKYIKVVDRRVDATGQNLYSELDKARKELQETKNVFDETKEKIDDASKKINNAYSEFVSILGIFSAIVLVFFGGTSILGNVAAILNENSVYVALTVILLTGLIVFNIIFMFIYFLSKLLDRSISATTEPVYWKGILGRFKDRYPIIFWVNIFVFIILYIMAVVWSIEKLIEINAIAVIGTFLVKNHIYLKHRELTEMIVLIGLYINVTFAFAYMLSKISDVNIGRHIYLRCNTVYSIEKEEFAFYVVTDYDYGRGRKMKWKWLAYPYMLIANVMSFLLAKGFNFWKRVFCRYPYLTVLNVILMALFIISLDLHFKLM